jgi:hypothetical protein
VDIDDRVEILSHTLNDGNEVRLPDDANGCAKNDGRILEVAEDVYNRYFACRDETRLGARCDSDRDRNQKGQGNIDQKCNY